jgi:hypothetical protein
MNESKFQVNPTNPEPRPEVLRCRYRVSPVYRVQRDGDGIGIEMGMGSENDHARMSQ